MQLKRYGLYKSNLKGFLSFLRLLRRFFIKKKIKGIGEMGNVVRKWYYFENHDRSFCSCDFLISMLHKREVSRRPKKKLILKEIACVILKEDVHESWRMRSTRKCWEISANNQYQQVLKALIRQNTS